MQQPSNFLIRHTVALMLLVVILAAVFMLLHLPSSDESTLTDPQRILPVVEATAGIPLHNPENVPSTQPPPDNNSVATPGHHGQLAIVPRPAWTLDGQLQEHLPELKKLADSGDMEAAYILAMNLRFCVVVPVTGDELQQRLEQAHKYQDDGAAATELSEGFEFCAGIDGALRQQFYHYFATAALQGYVPAQEMIGLITPELYMKVTGNADLDRDAYVKTRDAFIQQKFALLESASQQGSLNALIQLSQLHYSQNYGQHGRMKAYAMNQTILELAQDNDVYNKYTWFQNKAQTELTPEEIESAHAMSQQWLDIIKANGTLYLQ